jgi:hypothetical protein
MIHTIEVPAHLEIALAKNLPFEQVVIEMG